MKKTLSVILILVIVLALFSTDVLAGAPVKSGENAGINDQEGGILPGDEGTAEPDGDDSDPNVDGQEPSAPGGEDPAPGTEDDGETDDPALTIPAEGGALASGSYTLTEDLTVASPLTLSAGTEVVIDLNGHQLTFSQKGFVNNGKLTVRNGSISVPEYAFETNAGSVTELEAVDVTVADYGLLVVNDGTVTAVNCNLQAKSYPVDVYNGNVTLTGSSVTSQNMAVYTNQNSSGNVTLNTCTIQGSKRALNQWGNGTILASQTTFISNADPCVEANRGTVTLKDHCVLKRTDGELSTFENKKECKFDFDPTTEFNGTWDDYHSTQWIDYVKEKYPDGIPASEYEELVAEVPGEGTKNVVKIYTADGLAWFAYQLTVQRTSYVGKTILLENDVDLGGHGWRATIGTNFVDATFDGQGHVIRNMKTNNIAGNGSGSVGYGFIGDMSANSGPFTIKNVTFDSARINGTIGSGVVLGCWGCDATLEQVHVVNSYTRGHKSGGLAGAVDDGARNIIIRNCSVEGTTVDTTSVHIRAGGMIGRVETACTVNIIGSHVSNSTIDASFYGGGLIGVVESGGASIVLDESTYVSGITVAERDVQTELHTVTLDGEVAGNTRCGMKNVIVDGLYLDGAKYGSSLANYYWGAYAEFYVWGPPPTSYDANTYLGSTVSEHYGDEVQKPIANLELGIGSHNYDYGTHTVKPSVIYYAVYNDGLNTRNVLYGYEYVSKGEAAQGKTLYGELDCSSVSWYTDPACTQAYDFTSPVTESITLYTPLELWDGAGELDPQRLTAVQDALPQLDGLTVTWAARQKGSLDIPTTAVAEIPDMTLKIYTGFVVTFDPNGGNLNCPETVFVPAKGVLAAPVDPARDGYVFDGWYTAKDGGERWQFGTPITQSMTLYAHWSTHASLTITKSNTLLENQSFVYRVTGENIDLVVTLHGNGSVTIDMLPLGEYTVQEISAWSWRYTPAEQKSVSLVKGNATVSFDNGIQETAWLSGENYGG